MEKISQPDLVKVKTNQFTVVPVARDYSTITNYLNEWTSMCKSSYSTCY
jgi:hypothetical protein